jgi:hypothetical protein
MIRSLARATETPRLYVAKALIWCARSVYNGEWRPPAIWEFGQGSSRQSLAVKRIAASQQIDRILASQMNKGVLNSILESRKQAMVRDMVEALIQGNFVQFTKHDPYAMSHIEYRAEMRVVEPPKNITARSW